MNSPISTSLVNSISESKATILFFSKYSQILKELGGDIDKIDPVTGISRACDFTIGNSHEPPLEAYVNQLSSAVIPNTNGYFNYVNDTFEESKLVVQEYIMKRVGVNLKVENIKFTTGAVAALSCCIKLVSNPEDEIIFFCTRMVFLWAVDCLPWL